MVRDRQLADANARVQQRHVILAVGQNKIAETDDRQLCFCCSIHFLLP